MQAVNSMEERVTYQLRRARASGTTGLGAAPIPVGPILDDLRLTLDKVYRDKGIRTDLDVQPGTTFMGDSGDFTEVAGNVIENAYKYGRRRVRVQATSTGGVLRLIVEDDGPGISPADVEVLLQRGTRADESVPGYGIGLAVAKEIAELYGGRLGVQRAELGGARIEVELRRASLTAV
jgi:two-component system sensor histidine kinase PhoQ